MKPSPKEMKEMLDFLQDKIESSVAKRPYVFANSCICLLDDESNVRELANIMGAKGFCGASKAAYYFNECPNFIFKVPFYTSTYESPEYFDGDKSLEKILSDWHEEEEDSYYYLTDFEYANTLEGAFSDYYEVESLSKWDYCEIESFVYSIAEEYGLAQYFAGTWYLGKICGSPVYVSEYCPGSFNVYEYDRVKSRTSINNVNIEVEMELTHGGYAEDLFTFIEDFCISDICARNVQYADDGTLRLIDYSNFYEQI